MVLVTLVLSVACAVIGLAISPRGLIKSSYTWGIGMAALIGTGSFLSSMLNRATGAAIIFTIGIGLVILLLRLFVDPDFRALSRFNLLHMTAPATIGVTFIALLIQKSGFELASRNFDAYYAIQDALFLSTKPAYQHLSSPTEILPLTWSASTNDRYGVSYLLSGLQKAGIGNVWWNAQYVMIFCLMLLAILVMSFLKNNFKLSSAESSLLAPVIIFSPAFLIPLVYFMFGQVLGLAIVVTIFGVFAFELRENKKPIYSLLLTSTLIVIYPAMLFPMALFWASYFLIFSHSSLLNRLKLFFLFCFSLSISAIFQYGFHVTVIGHRLWTWVAGSLFSHPPKTDSLHFSATVFGQYASRLGIPLFTGFVRYPMMIKINNFYLIALIIVSICLFIVAYSTLITYFKRRMLVIPLSFLSSWVLMAVVSYLKGNSYLVIKFSTWTMPLIFGIACAGLYKFLNNKSFNKISIRLKIASVLAAVGVIASLSTAFSYASTLKTWNSFSQVPNPRDYSLLAQTKLPGTSRIGIVAPTAEEAAWTAGLFKSVDQSRFFSLGPSIQALGEGLQRQCELNSVEKNFDDFGFLLINVKMIDVTSPLNMSKDPVLKVGNLRLYRVAQFESGVVINGEGLYPPNKLSKIAGASLPKSSLRWSSGSFCLGIYSSKNSEKVLDLRTFAGPDLKSKKTWMMKLGGTTSPLTYKNGIQQINLNLKAGWNLLQISQPGCDETTSFGRNWSARADDRHLCFALTEATLLN